MPGLIGIVSAKDENSSIEGLLPKMCRAIKHEEFHKIDHYIGKFAGMGRVHPCIFNPEPQPVYNEDRTLCLIMDGEIYDYEDLKNELIQKGHKFSINNDPEFILHMYEEYGTDLVNKINGSFTLALWNENQKKLTIINDRYGIRPLYFAVHKGYLLFGSEVKAILEDNTFERTVDHRSIAEFFSFGYILGSKTFFQGIELLPPASIMTYNLEKIEITQYWDFKFREVYDDISEKECTRELSRLILQAVKRQTKGVHRIGIPLSGGLDSRTIAASIQKKNYPVHTFSFGRKDSDDVKIAKIVSERLGMQHHFFEFKPDDLIYYAEKAVYLTDGMQNCIHAHRMQTYNEVRDFMDVALIGWIGDSAIGSGFLRSDQSMIDDKFELFKIISGFYSTDFLSNLFSNDYFPVFKENFALSKNYILKIDENANINLSNNRLMYYNFKERQRRFILMGPVLVKNSIEIRMPFADNDLIDFVLQIPPEFKINKHLYIKTILSMFPDLADCPYQATGLPLNASTIAKRSKSFFELVKKITNTYSRKIFKIKLFVEENRNFHDYNNWIRNNKELREYITGILLDERTINRHYFNRKYIKEILDSHIGKSEDHAELIGRLLTFELWNRLFIDRK